MIQVHIHFVFSILITGITQKHKAGRVSYNIQYSLDFLYSIAIRQ